MCASTALSPGALHLAQRLADEAHSALVMGIVNVTPDSFSDGGQFSTPEKAVAQAMRLREEGAELLDLGAESTRPGFTPVSAEEEWARLQPVLEHLQRLVAHPSPFLSIDTTKARVAEAALKTGAVVVNDVQGFQQDADMASVVAAHGSMAVLMHNRPHLATEGIVLQGALWEDFERWFDVSLELAERAGVSRAALMLDPGIGFGKTLAQNFEALGLTGRLRDHYGLPVLVGASRKSMFGKLLGRSVEERLPATLAAHLEAVRLGARVIRAHDVQAHSDALAVQHRLQASQMALQKATPVPVDMPAGEEPAGETNREIG